MRASRTYGSVRGARHETRVPTATRRREFITLLGGAAGVAGGRRGRSNQSVCRWSEFSWGPPTTQKRGRG